MKRPIRDYIERISNTNKILASGIFDMRYYREQVGAEFAEPKDAVRYFLAQCGSSDADPHPLFSTSWYRRKAGLARQTNPLLHFIGNGHLTRQDPHPLFSLSWYREKNGESLPADMNPLSHYLHTGWKQRCPVHPLFDDAWYRATYPDIDHPDIDAFIHFVIWGSVEGRNPSEFFDTSWYKTEYDPSGNALAHYMIEGAGKGFDPSSRFSTRFYVKTNPDVAHSDINPLVHFVEVGRVEGRPPVPRVSLDSRFGIERADFARWRDDVLLQYRKPTAVDGGHGAVGQQTASRHQRLIVKFSPGATDGFVTDEEFASSSETIEKACELLGIDAKIVCDADCRAFADDLSSGVVVLFLQQGDMLDAAGLEALWASLRPDTRLCVFDMFFTTEGMAFPVCLPGFNPIHIRTVDCTFSRFAISGPDLRRALDAGELDDRGCLLSALDRIVAARDDGTLLHLPAPILQVPDLTDQIRRMREARLSSSSADLSRVPGGRVSIIICTKDKGLLLNQLLLSLFGHSDPHIADVVIVANEVTNAYARRTLREWADHPKIKILDYDEPFNFSKQSNLGAAMSSGDFVLFLNDDIVPVAADWLQHLMAPFADPSVGMTGPLLLYPNETVQHGGMYIGNGHAHHVLRHARLPHEDYMFMATAAREVSVVTGAVLLMRRSDFEQAHGFDVKLPSTYQDVDLCLRISKLGRHIYYVPTAILLHMESVTILPAIAKFGAGTRPQEAKYFQDRYGEAFLAKDPFFNPRFDPNDPTLHTLEAR